MSKTPKQNCELRLISWCWVTFLVSAMFDLGLISLGLVTIQAHGEPTNADPDFHPSPSVLPEIENKINV